MVPIPGPHDLQARELADRYWDEFLALEPLFATQVGDERFDHLLPDPTPAGLGRRASVHGGALTNLAQIDRGALNQEGRTALDVVEALATKELAAIEHRFDRFDAADHMWGPGTMLAQIGAVQQADNSERLERYVARLGVLPDFLAASAEILRDAAGSGLTSPRLVVDRTIAQVERLLRIGPAESPAISPVPESDAEGRTRVQETLRDRVFPAYQTYLQELRDHRPFARVSLGLGSLPGGDELYAAKIVAWTTPASRRPGDSPAGSPGTGPDPGGKARGRWQGGRSRLRDRHRSTDGERRKRLRLQGGRPSAGGGAGPAGMGSRPQCPRAAAKGELPGEASGPVQGGRRPRVLPAGHGRQGSPGRLLREHQEP